MKNLIFYLFIFIFTTSCENKRITIDRKEYDKLAKNDKAYDFGDDNVGIYKGKLYLFDW